MDAYIGEVRMFGGNYAPQGWHLCDGTLLPISQNQALFSLLGVSFGGDGITNFAVPDLRGRLPVGQGQGAGLTARTLGQSGGTETVSLTAANNASHSHPFTVANAAATTPTAGPGVTFAAGQSGDVMYFPTAATAPTFESPNAATVGISTGGVPHDNIMPSLVVNFIICTAGIFPSRS